MLLGHFETCYTKTKHELYMLQNANSVIKETLFAEGR